MKSSTVYSNSVQRCAVLSGPVQSCPAHSSPVSPTQVKSHPRKFNAMYFHLEHFNSIKENCNNPVPWSAVLSSPVQSSPVHSAVYFNLECNVVRNALRLSQMKYNLKQCGAVHYSKVPFRKGHIQVPVSAVWSSHSSLMKCLQMLSWRAFSKW